MRVSFLLLLLLACVQCGAQASRPWPQYLARLGFVTAARIPFKDIYGRPHWLPDVLHYRFAPGELRWYDTTWVRHNWRYFALHIEKPQVIDIRKLGYAGEYILLAGGWLKFTAEVPLKPAKIIHRSQVAAATKGVDYE